MNRRITLTLFVVLPMTALAILFLVGSILLYQEEQAKEAWTETSGRITRIEHHDVLTPITVGRKWRRRTEFVKNTQLVKVYEYRDSYGYKHEGRERRTIEPSTDWRNGRKVIADIGESDREVKVYYNPHKTPESRLYADDRDFSIVVMCVAAMLVFVIADAVAIRFAMRQ